MKVRALKSGEWAIGGVKVVDIVEGKEYDDIPGNECELMFSAGWVEIVTDEKKEPKQEEKKDKPVEKLEKPEKPKKTRKPRKNNKAK